MSKKQINNKTNEQADIFGGSGKETSSEIKARLQDFERRQLDERAKFLAEQVEPIRQRIVLLNQQRRQIDAELNGLNDTLAELEGRPSGPSGGNQKKRRRRSRDQILELGQVIYDKMKGSRLNRFKPAELEQYLDGMKARDVIALWNQTHKDKAVQREGDKTLSRYYIA